MRPTIPPRHGSAARRPVCRRRKRRCGSGRGSHESRRPSCVIAGPGVENTTELRSSLKRWASPSSRRSCKVAKTTSNLLWQRTLGRHRRRAKQHLAGHPWSGVDLVIIHTNATPANSSASAKRLAWRYGTGYVCCSPCSPLTHHRLKPAPRCESLKLQSDRTILRELANQQTTGERAGYGGGGITALQGVLANLNRN